MDVALLYVKESCRDFQTAVINSCSAPADSCVAFAGSGADFAGSCATLGKPVTTRASASQLDARRTLSAVSCLDVLDALGAGIAFIHPMFAPANAERKSAMRSAAPTGFEARLGYPYGRDPDTTTRWRRTRIRHHMMNPVTASAAGSSPAAKMIVCQTPP